MNKKITLLALALFLSAGLLKAQLSLEIIHQDSTIVGNAWSDGDLPAHAVVKNISGLPVEVALKRIDGNYNELTDSNAICWGLCFTTNISQNPPSFNRTLQPGATDTAILHVYPDRDGYTRSGPIQYVLFDYYNPSDSVAFTVNYQVNGVPLSQKEVAKPELSVYPNPADDFLRVQYEVTKDASFELINLVGAKVYSTRLDAQSTEMELDLSNLNPGVYFYTLKSEGKVVISRKLVIR